uniref:Uncharacterized protein n=1 Tax=Coccidioides posadasii RMSCC 3488 TaxID=454284 RepID=A0A0J6FTB8_COCPO|nr:hypothetical protein CPAG_08899 [Coccidioides posadasii RMSCC 3488]
MGQKHNRRRARHRSLNARTTAVMKRYPHLIPDLVSLHGLLPYDGYAATSLPSHLPQVCTPGPGPTWRSRYLTLQTRDRRQCQFTSRFEVEQCCLFGGEPGDDVDLCYRMLEYFDGLDYIDT